MQATRVAGIGGGWQRRESVSRLVGKSVSRRRTARPEIKWFAGGDVRLVSMSGVGWTKRGGIVRRATRLEATRASLLRTIAGADRGWRVSSREVRAGRSCLGGRVALAVGAAADVVNGLVDEVGDAGLVEGGHEV